MTPIRIQRKRTKGWKMPENTVYVGRPTKWGNPFTLEEELKRVSPLWPHIKENSKLKTVFEYALSFMMFNYERFMNRNTSLTEEAKKELKGKNLACWCKVGEPCHADVLLEIVNK